MYTLQGLELIKKKGNPNYFPIKVDQKTKKPGIQNTFWRLERYDQAKSDT